MVFRIQAVRVLIGGIHTQFFGAPVHHGGKILHASRDVLGNGDCRVVAASEHQPIEHLFHGQCFAFRKVDRGSGNAMRVFGGGDGFGKLAIFQRQKRGHDLGGRSHGQHFIRVLRKEHAAACSVDQNRTFCADRERFGSAGGAKQQQHSEKSGELFHATASFMTWRYCMLARRTG